MNLIETGASPIKAWVDGVEFDDGARAQVAAMAALPFVHSHVAIMPDVHAGKGATVGSVLPTLGAIVPAAVGVDIGCGVVAQRTTLRAEDLPDDLHRIRTGIESIVPVGLGAHVKVPAVVDGAWEALAPQLDAIRAKHPKATARRAREQLATLGGGNHFIELALDEDARVWVMLHSGSRGIGNAIGSYFIERAKHEMERAGVVLANRDLAHLTENTANFDDYIEALAWAQDYAVTNRRLMLRRVLGELRERRHHLPRFELTDAAVDCHHNYVARERHFGADVYVTRKGAVRAGRGELGVIPGSMGSRSFIVRGKGNPESFESCSHGAGRRLSRGAAKERITLGEFAAQTRGVECRKDRGVIDEAPAAYKSIDAVMRAQRDLVTIEHTLKQVVCVKG